MTVSQSAPGKTKQLGIIGGGVMAEAILSGLLAQKAYAAADLVVSDVTAQRLDYLATTYGIATTLSNLEVSQTAATVVLAVKPQTFSSIAAEFAGAEIACDLWLSILAGVPLSKLEAALGSCAIIRVMPNTPALVGAGITALAPGKSAQPHHIATAAKIFAAVGEVLTVSETWMDAITGCLGLGRLLWRSPLKL